MSPADKRQRETAARQPVLIDEERLQGVLDGKRAGIILRARANTHVFVQSRQVRVVLLGKHAQRPGARDKIRAWGIGKEYPTDDDQFVPSEKKRLIQFQTDTSPKRWQIQTE